MRSIKSIHLLFACFLVIGLVPLSTSAKASAIDSLRRLSGRELSVKEKIRLNLELSKQYSNLELDSTLYYSNGARKLSKQIEYPIGIGSSLFSIGELEIQYDSLFVAQQYLSESLKYLKDCDCDSLKAEVYFSIGRIYLLHDNYSDAQEFFIKSLQLTEKSGINIIRFKIYFWMALMYDSMENNVDAEHYYLKAVQLSDTLNDKQITAFSFFSLSRFYVNKGDFATAEKYIQNAITIIEKMKYYGVLPLVYNEKGNILFGLQKYKQALTDYHLAAQAVLQIDTTNIFQIHYWTAFTIFYTGRCYYKTGNYLKAINLLNGAMAMAKQQELLKLEVETYEYLAKAYEQIGKPGVALKYYKHFHSLDDSIINAYNVSKVTKMEMKYRHMKELHKKQIMQLQSDQKYQREILLLKIGGFTGFLMLIILSLILFNYRIRQRAKIKHEKLKQEKLKVVQAHLESELSMKDRELTTSVMYLLKKNNYMLSLNEKLKNAILPLKPELKKPINDIIRETEFNIESDTWKEFETRFNQVHQHFVENLLKDFPELTPNELKICAFLKLNMSTKEILTITHQSSNSISVARHRLRTKLGIDRDENLVTFLSKY